MRFECGPEWDIRAIHIKPKNKIGIMMTGGNDSWVLYNLLKTVIGDTSKILIFNIQAVGPGGTGHDLPERISFLTGRDDIIKIDKYIKLTDNDKPYFKPWCEVMKMSMDHMLEDFDIDELYMGDTMNPPIEFFPEFDIPGKPRRQWYIPESYPVKSPLLHLYKYHIIDLANKHNIDLSHTHSCIDLPDPDHCGKCWFCLEKAWGYNQLKTPTDISNY
tara:strand:+ start:168 stop:818 length:651 start_codon:yes stop_codon:yes gene_type:complete